MRNEKREDEMEEQQEAPKIEEMVSVPLEPQNLAMGD